MLVSFKRYLVIIIYLFEYLFEYFKTINEIDNL